MNKLIGTLGVICLALFFRVTALSVIATAADPFQAEATTYGRFCLVVYRAVVAIEANLVEYIFVAAGAGLYAFAFGWLTHLMLHERGFGTRINVLVGLAGSAAAIAFYHRYGGDLSLRNYGPVAVAGLAGSVGALGLAALLKSVVADKANDANAAKAGGKAVRERLSKVTGRK